MTNTEYTAWAEIASIHYGDSFVSLMQEMLNTDYVNIKIQHEVYAIIFVKVLIIDIYLYLKNFIYLGEHL